MIHWHEGLFLLPQHFQGLQRMVGETVTAERGLLHRYASGVLDLELDILKESIAVRRLVVITPSGIRLEYPDNVDVPARHIAGELMSGKEFQVSVGLPLRSDHGANVASTRDGANDHSAYLFKTVEMSLADENVGGQKKPVLIRKYNARLVLDSDDRSNLELVPLVRIRVQGASGLPALSPKYCPPLLRLRGWQPLYSQVSDAVRDLELARDDIRSRMLEGGFDIEKLHGNQLALVLKLRAVQSSLPKLKALLEAPQASPFEVYLELGSLVGDLGAQFPIDEAPPCEGFRPDDLQRQMDELLRLLHSRLQSGPVSSYTVLDFEAGSDGIQLVELTREFVEGKKQFFLCVTSSESRDRVVGLVTDSKQFKLTTPALVTRPRNGVRLTQSPPPAGVPARQDWHYFRIEHREEPALWGMVEKELKMASEWPRSLRDAITKLSLYSF